MPWPTGLRLAVQLGGQAHHQQVGPLLGRDAAQGGHVLRRG